MEVVGPFGITRKATRIGIALDAPAELIEALELETDETPERREASGGRLVSGAVALRYAYRFTCGSLGRRMRHLR